MRSDILNKFIGLTYEQAVELSYELSYELRLVQKDGVKYWCTQDLRFDRLNITIVEDLIMEIYIG